MPGRAVLGCDSPQLRGACWTALRKERRTRDERYPVASAAYGVMKKLKELPAVVQLSFRIRRVYNPR
jgi:hypothetical protein